MSEAVQKDTPQAQPAITLTPEAAERLQAEIDRKGGEIEGLRLMVFPGGCAGLEYAMSFAKGEPHDIETIVDTGSVPIYVETQALDVLQGAVIRYVDNLIGGGFQVENPNADNTCGCGKSFC